MKNYIESLKKIYDLGIPYLKKKWLCGEMDQADLIRLLPTLMFATQNTNADRNQLNRFARFFHNIPRFSHIRRNPDTYCVHSINLTAEFLADGKEDVVYLLEYKNNENYDRILTEEEIFKLNLYKIPPTNTQREDLEKEFWKAEDYTLFLGQIDFLFYCMDIDMVSDEINSFSLNTFNQLAFNNYQLFGDSFSPDDLLRRALLTKGDYSIKDGNTPKLGGERWTFIRSIEKWRLITKNSLRKKYLKELLTHYAKIKLLQNDRRLILNQIIDSYAKSEDEKKLWINYFITEPKILEYCLSKNFCWIDGSLAGIYLLRDTRATDGSYVLLSDFLQE